MNIDTTMAVNYSWMSQASYLDLHLLGIGQLSDFRLVLSGSGYNKEKRLRAERAPRRRFSRTKS